MLNEPKGYWPVNGCMHFILSMQRIDKWMQLGRVQGAAIAPIARATVHHEQGVAVWS